VRPLPGFFLGPHVYYLLKCWQLEMLKRVEKFPRDEWVKTLPADEAAKKTGRSLRAVYARRRRLGMPDGRRGD
jgi:hypothetical protein